jgi:hypothetical protein
MKKLVFAFLVLSVLYCVKGQVPERPVEYTATIGAGVTINKPSFTIFTFQALGHYHLNKRLSAGIGTGISLYETMMTPIFADVKFTGNRPRKFTPYMECAAGYALAVNKNSNGGLYLNPSIGGQYPFQNRMKFLFAAGYELQKTERLKTYANDYITVNFAEKLTCHSISIKVGVVY